MKTLAPACFALLACAFPAAAWCEPGEYWEDTTTVAMPDAPAPAHPKTHRVCRSHNFVNISDAEIIERIARNIQRKQTCHITNKQKVGDKIVWAAACKNARKADATVNIKGELTKTTSSYHATLHLSLADRHAEKSQQMSFTIDSKRLGESCEIKNKIAGREG